MISKEHVMDRMQGLTLTDKEKEFLLDLYDLQKKYGLLIGGCGCCGGPYILEPETNREVISRLGILYSE